MTEFLSIPTKNKFSKAEKLAKLFDSSIKVPGTSKSIGLDGIIGIIPGIGDSITSAVSGYIVMLAFQDGVSRLTVVRMIINIVVDIVVGTIPIIGDFSDLFWKANIRNIDLWKLRGSSKRQSTADLLFIILLFCLLALMVGATVYGSIWLILLAWRNATGM